MSGAPAVMVIPAYEPTAALADLVVELSADGREIVVVDDGSSAAARAVFARVARQPRVTLLEHAVNLGKGQALKTAFNHILLHGRADSVGVVTADADGQHLAADIRRVAERLEAAPDTLVLGSRGFEGRVPLRNRIGNTVTRGVFRLLLRRPIVDTQTGLRGIPRMFLPSLLSVDAGRYEFELEMLVRAAAENLAIVEVPIQTVYGGAGQSHFNPLRDSVRIYFVFLRFLGLSLATAGVDYLLFVLTFIGTRNILASTAAARAVAGTFNFTCNRAFVFKSRGELRREALKYASLVFAFMWMSYALLTMLVVFVGIPVLIAKLVADGSLFVASFAIQDLFVFSDRERPAAAALSTDWQAYYRRRRLLAPFTREVTARAIAGMVAQFADSAPRHIAELGGGNSAFLPRFRAQYPDAELTAVDTEAVGLELTATRLAGDRRLRTVHGDVRLPVAQALGADVVFSAGLVEHFDPAGTAQAIAAHFAHARPGGLVVITFPTETWLYRLLRGAAEALGVWHFPDERPIPPQEAARQAARHGELLAYRTLWRTGLTQGILTARRRLPN